MFYLIRHGKTDYSARNTKIYQGMGVNLSPLAEKGILETKQAAMDERLIGADIIVSSPYTRALQTAAILSKHLQVDIAIETDLYEWLANKHYIYEPDDTAEAAYQAYLKCGGHPASDQTVLWESADEIRERSMAVLNKYRHYNKVIVTCHGMLIEALSGTHPHTGGIVPYDL